MLLLRQNTALDRKTAHLVSTVQPRLVKYQLSLKVRSHQMRCVASHCDNASRRIRIGCHRTAPHDTALDVNESSGLHW